MLDFQGGSVYLAIYLNRSQSPVFSTTLYAHGGKASISLKVESEDHHAGNGPFQALGVNELGGVGEVGALLL